METGRGEDGENLRHLPWRGMDGWKKKDISHGTFSGMRMMTWFTSTAKLGNSHRGIRSHHGIPEGGPACDH
jgi:hypothetical protein